MRPTTSDQTNRRRTHKRTVCILDNPIGTPPDDLRTFETQEVLYMKGALAKFSRGVSNAQD